MKCLYYRWRALWSLDGGAGPSVRVRAHLAACASCRERHERELAVAAQLRREAQALSRRAPGALSAQIMSAVRADGAPRTRARPAVAPVWLGATAVAALAVGAVWWHGRAPAHALLGPAPLAAQAGSAPSVSELVEAVRPLASSWESWSVTPLEAESTALRDDLSNASRHLYACLEP